MRDIASDQRIQILLDFIRSVEANDAPGRLEPDTTGDSIGALSDGIGRLVEKFQCSGERNGNCHVGQKPRLTRSQRLQSKRIESIGLLASGIAHDFGNILSVIGLSCESILAASPGVESVKVAARQILDAQRRGAALTKQLLAFCRNETARPVTLNLGEVILGMGDMLRQLAGTDVELAIASSPKNPVHTHAERIQVEQILMNLLVNARDAVSARKNGKISIKLTEETIDRARGANPFPIHAGKYAVISVEDNGHGMDAATVHSIFDPFFTTKKKGKGTGLGLSIVYKIVSGCRGGVFVKSELDAGTCFKVYLPLSERPTNPAVGVPTVEPNSTGPGKKTILVAEDEETLREIFCASLRRNGYHVLEAPNGLSAREALKEHPGTIDLVITDAVMPGLGGRALAEICLRLRPNTQVLYISGYSAEELAKHGISTGGKFLEKPFTGSAILEKVREILDATD